MTIKLNTRIITIIALVTLMIVSLIIGVNTLLKNTTYQVGPWERISLTYKDDDEERYEITLIAKIVHYENLNRVDVYYYDADGTTKISRITLQGEQLLYFITVPNGNGGTHIFQGRT